VHQPAALLPLLLLLHWRGCHVFIINIVVII
jgi:hypothetical protein